MKKSSWKPYAGFLVLTQAVGALSALLSRQANKAFQANAVKPPLSPPPVVFPIVWSALYLLMGVSAARLYLAPKTPARANALLLYGMQLTLNFFWSLFFFNLEAYGFSFFWLLALLAAVLAWAVLSWKCVDRPAGALQLPYLLWLVFAAYLNAAVWQLNG